MAISLANSQPLEQMPAKILYVEDEPFLGKIVKESLESRGFEIKMVSDGAKVMPAFLQYQPNICVLDVMLPNVDGYTLGQQIKQTNPGTPIIFLTAKTQTEDVLKGFKNGGNDYLRKPFSLQELVVRIQNLLDLSQAEAQGLAPDTFIWGNLEFEPGRFQLRLDNKVQKLSHRETELLKILALHPNEPVSRRFILKEIWGDDSFFNSRNLDVYITRLRNLLKSDPDIQIVTLKGVGYQFVVTK